MMITRDRRFKVNVTSKRIYLMIFALFTVVTLMCNAPTLTSIVDPDAEEIIGPDVEVLGAPPEEIQIPQEEVIPPEEHEEVPPDQPVDVPPPAVPPPSSGIPGTHKPVGFVNNGTINAMIMPCTWVPSGSEQKEPAPDVSTISTHPGAPGLWPNPSRFLSLPLGTYTWCMQYDEGDQDGDSMIDYFHFIDDREVTLTEDDSDDHDFAREVHFSAPPGPGMDILPGTCAEEPLCRALGGVRAFLVTNSSLTSFESGVALQGVEYNSASISLFIDPSLTAWIAWNNAPGVTVRSESKPGEAFLGPGGFGTDDYIALTVINPDGGELTLELDHNDATGRWEGQQNVIFGTAGEAPDVYRQYPSFADPPSKEFFIDEGGSFNAIFTSAGEYQFRFSFLNRFSSSASHHDIYILISDR